MKIKLLVLIPLAIFLQGGCSDDDDGGSDGTNNNYITFQGVTNDGNGGCNVQSDTGLDISCVYSVFYQLDGLSYGIAISHDGVCRSGTFNLSDGIDQSSDAFFVLQITSDGVPVETFVGSSGTVDLVDSGVSSSASFDGTVISLDTGVTESISGYVKCPL
ncbi:hypothetical protein AB9K26_13165 [Psychroserpens sp. XS_ASV72]|uniref:hypothetical protein n=1 Tax=Psychroserpens sp. XS_ASV72 TaxID=3241293 RepID=UPI0035186F1C